MGPGSHLDARAEARYAFALQRGAASTDGAPGHPTDDNSPSLLRRDLIFWSSSRSSTRTSSGDVIFDVLAARPFSWRRPGRGEPAHFSRFALDHRPRAADGAPHFIAEGGYSTSSTTSALCRGVGALWSGVPRCILPAVVLLWQALGGTTVTDRHDRSPAPSPSALIPRVVGQGLIFALLRQGSPSEGAFPVNGALWALPPARGATPSCARASLRPGFSLPAARWATATSSRPFAPAPAVLCRARSVSWASSLPGGADRGLVGLGVPHPDSGAWGLHTGELSCLFCASRCQYGP